MQVVTRERIDAAEKVVNAHMGLGEMKHFNRALVRRCKEACS